MYGCIANLRLAPLKGERRLFQALIIAISSKLCALEFVLGRMNTKVACNGPISLS